MVSLRIKGMLPAETSLSKYWSALALGQTVSPQPGRLFNRSKHDNIQKIKNVINTLGQFQVTSVIWLTVELEAICTILSLEPV